MMSLAESFRRASLFVPLTLALGVLAGCGEKTATAPLPEVPAGAATPPPVPKNAPTGRNVGPGSNAAQDSTINP